MKQSEKRDDIRDLSKTKVGVQLHEIAHSVERIRQEQWHEGFRDSDVQMVGTIHIWRAASSRHRETNGIALPPSQL